MLEVALINEVTAPHFNPPAIVEQMRMMPFARIHPDLVKAIEDEFTSTLERRHDAWADLANIIKDDEFKNDGQEFHSLISSFEKQADEIGQKLYSLEKAIRRAQKEDPARDVSLDDRLLKVARLDFEDRIDTSIFWRALQARIWPSPVSESYTSSKEIGDALRNALR